MRVFDSLLHEDGRSLLGCFGDSRFEFVRGDVRDAAAVEGALDDVGAIVHLAAIVGDPACSREPDEAREVNSLATSKLLEAAERRSVGRFVFASTCSNYGKLNGSSYATEEFELKPVSLYAETKVAAELEVLARNRPDFQTVCLRLATVYGASARMRFDLTVNEFTRDVELGRKLVVYGEQFWRPYVHVRDAALAIADVLEAEASLVAGEVFNVGRHGRELPEGRPRRAPAGAPPRARGGVRPEGRGPARLPRELRQDQGSSRLRRHEHGPRRDRRSRQGPADRARSQIRTRRSIEIEVRGVCTRAVVGGTLRDAVGGRTGERGRASCGVTLKWGFGRLGRRALCVGALLFTAVVAGASAPAAVTPSGFTDEVVWTRADEPDRGALRPRRTGVRRGEERPDQGLRRPHRPDADCLRRPPDQRAQLLGPRPAEPRARPELPDAAYVYALYTYDAAIGGTGAALGDGRA